MRGSPPLSLLPRCTADSSCQKYLVLRKQDLPSAEEGKVGSRIRSRSPAMKTYLPRQRSCCRESDGVELARGVPTLSRGVHCPSSWQENAPGHCGYHQHHGQALTSTAASGPLCPTPSQAKTRCHPTWDNAQRNPRKTLAKVKGMSRGRSTECTCAHNWHEPIQVSLFRSQVA